MVDVVSVMKGVFVFTGPFAVSKSGVAGGAGRADVPIVAAALQLSSSLPRQRFSPIGPPWPGPASEKLQIRAVGAAFDQFILFVWLPGVFALA